MATNTDKPVGPGTFTRAPYSVTIAEDGKILVRKDDWLSKYSWALYGDYTTLDVFVRPDPPLTSPSAEIKGIKEIEDVDEIVTGEYLIHVPTYFEWAGKRGKPVKPRQPKKSEPTKPGSVYSNNWMVASIGGIDVPAEVVLAGGGGFLAFRNMDTGDTFYYFYLRAGVGLGIDISKWVKKIRTMCWAIGKVLLLQKLMPSDFVPLVLDPDMGMFAAKTLDLASTTSRCWSVGSGSPNQNYAYEKLDFFSGHSRFGSAVFSGNSFLGLPGGSVSATGGFLVWIW